jgi:hypothetical protein
VCNKSDYQSKTRLYSLYHVTIYFFKLVTHNDITIETVYSIDSKVTNVVQLKKLIYAEEYEILGENLSQCYFVCREVPHGLTYDRTRAAAVRSQ